jgi:hypothetical protein
MAIVHVVGKGAIVAPFLFVWLGTLDAIPTSVFGISSAALLPKSMQLEWN